MKAIIPLLIAAASASHAQVVTAPTTAFKTHGSWHSVIRQDPQTPSGRAFTTSVQGNHLTLDYTTKNGCILPVVQILIPLRSTNEQVIDYAVSGTFRTDQNAPISFEGRFLAAPGDETAFIAINNVANVKSFLVQIIAGTTLRLVIDSSSDPLTERFALRGSDDAVRRAMALCDSL